MIASRQFLLVTVEVAITGSTIIPTHWFFLLVIRTFLFSTFFQDGIPVVDLFLGHYLHFWNGTDHRGSIFHLISRMHLVSFSSELHPFTVPCLLGHQNGSQFLSSS